jgi:hypothetical protein
MADSTNLGEVMLQLVMEEKKLIVDIQAVDVEVNKLMNDGSRSSAVVTDYRIFFK